MHLASTNKLAPIQTTQDLSSSCQNLVDRSNKLKSCCNFITSSDKLSSSLCDVVGLSSSCSGGGGNVGDTQKTKSQQELCAAASKNATIRTSSVRGSSGTSSLASSSIASSVNHTHSHQHHSHQHHHHHHHLIKNNSHDTNILWKFHCDINPSSQQMLTQQKQQQSSSSDTPTTNKKLEQNPDVVQLQNPTNNYNIGQDVVLQLPLNKLHHHDCGDRNSRTTAL